MQEQGVTYYIPRTYSKSNFPRMHSAGKIVQVIADAFDVIDRNAYWMSGEKQTKALDIIDQSLG